MPGTKGNRTKGNVKPSSSSRAAELLSQSGASGFIGFGSVGGAQAYVPASQVFDDVDSCLDGDFRVMMRKLTKRDATTKIKALGEFSALCREKDESTLLAVLQFWPRLFNKLAIDVDPKVREHTQNAMATLVSRVRRNLAPYLKNVMGAWILSRNDTYPTVSSAANRSFSAAFPPEKQTNAIVFCKQAVLEYLIDNLLNQTPSSLSDPKTTGKEEMEAKYQRVLASSLMGLRQLLQALPSAQVDDAVRAHLRGLLSDAKFWKFKSMSQVPSVRSGQFWFLGSVCQVVPDVATESVDKIGPLALGAIDILEPGLTAAVWDAVLSCVKFVPSCWENVNWQKAFWPKLRKILKSGCQGNATIVAPNFLPLFSCLPMELAGGAEVFFPEVLSLFKQGFAEECVCNSPGETNAWVRAFLECLTFSFRQIGAGEGPSQGVLKAILLDQLLPVVEASLFDPKPTLSRSTLNTLVSTFLQTIAAEDTAVSELATLFWSQLSADAVEMFETVGSGEKQSLRPDRIVTFVRALLCPLEASDNSSSRGKKERVRFAKEEGVQVQSGPVVAVELSDDVRCFVKKVVAHSHRLYRKDGQSLHFKLFVDLANLYFPEDMATFVLHSLERDTEAAPASGEGTAQTREGMTEENVVDAHSKVIDRVVLPVLGARERGKVEVAGHTITLLFACLPYLSEKSSTEVWDSVLQTVSITSALCSLVERALEKRQIMPQVSDWLSSPHLHARLCDLVATVTSQHSTVPPEELEQGWKIICLVLSANDNSEPVFPTSWIVDIVDKVRQELTMLASRPLEQKEIQSAIQFVAKAAITFFQNLKMSLCIEEGRDVIVALLMADLDSSLLLSGEVGGLVRQSWTTGLGLAVQDTGGFLQEGSMLSSACQVVRDTVVSKTHTLEQYRKVLEVTEALLKTTQNHLPQDGSEDDSDNDTYNPLLSGLLAPLSPSTADSKKIVHYLCLNGRLPLTVLDDLPVEEAEHSPSMATVVFSSLFNLHLLRCVRAGFRFDAGVCDDALEPSEWEEGEERILLDVMKALVLATSWSKVESQLSPDVGSAVEDLTNAAHACFSSAPKTVQQRLINNAFLSIEDHSLNCLTFSHLAHLYNTQQGRVDKEYFQQFCTREKWESALGTEAVLASLPQWLTADLFQLHTAKLVSLDHTPQSQAKIVACLRILRAILTSESAFISSNYADTLQDIVTQLKSIRNEEPTLFLFFSDVCDEAVARVAVNVAAMQFLTTVVTAGVFKLTPDLWDFILCSLVSWVESTDNSIFSLQSSVSVQAFGVEACHLAGAVAHIAQQPPPTGENPEDPYPPNLKTEWAKFFAEGIYVFLFPLFVKLVDQLKDTKTKGAASVVLSSVGSAMAQCPLEQIKGHHLPPNLAVSEDTSPIPECLQTVLNHLCPVLTCTSPPAQVAAFAVLDKIITLLPSYQKEEQEAEASASASPDASTSAEEESSRAPPMALIKVIEDCGTAMDVVLTPIPMETPITIAPGTEEYQFALGYLLAWQLLLHLFHSADSTGRAEYAAYLKEHANVHRLLAHLFRLMPRYPTTTISPSTPSKPPSEAAAAAASKTPAVEGEEDKSLSPSKPVRLLASEDSGDDSWFTSSDLPLAPVDVGQGTGDIQRASCRVYLHCLELIPVLTWGRGRGTSSERPAGCTFTAWRRGAGDGGHPASVLQGVPSLPGDVGQGTGDIQRASCRVYLHCLEVIPVLVRQWWKGLDRKSASHVDKFTSKYVSPYRIQSEMQAINSSGSSIQDLTVKARSVTRQVTATYTAEELNTEIQVTLPENYPLGEISVDAQRHAVVKLAQWDRLLLQVSVFLQHQNGHIMEGLRLWKRNLDKKMEGVEECFICYAVIHATSLDLPRVRCSTCKKKFHSACLYKWLNSSQKSTCPLCRSVFF
ncbi:hypothetical protein ACOMHN_055408 [Nucella lapillus]